MTERPHTPTRRRVARARREGDVPRSVELTGVAMLTAAAMLALFGSEWLLRAWFAASQRAFSSAGNLHAGDFRSGSGERVLEGFLPLLHASLIASGVFLLVSVASAALQVGFRFNLGSVKPDLGRLRPSAGWVRIFSRYRLGQTLRRGFFLMMLLVLGALVAWAYLPSLMGASTAPPDAMLDLLADLTWAVGGALLVGLWTSALLDYFGAHRDWWQRLHMTHREVERELRESEGDPVFRRERGKLALSWRQFDPARILDHAVVVLVDRFIEPRQAVALAYEPSSERPPRITGLGRGRMAGQLDEMARARGLGVHMNGELTKRLLRLRVGDWIPEELYGALAEVLSRSGREGERGA